MVHGAPARAHRWPSPPAWWLHDDACIVQAESTDNWHDTANPDSRGGEQFTYGTWQSVGGHGDPAMASRAEQTWRAYVLWRRRGWEPWTTAAGCGLR
jgi:hypothetical protein